MKVLVVSDALPGHDLGFQKSGHARYVGSILEHFAERGDDVTLMLLRPKVDFVVASARRLGVRVVGPELFGIGDAVIVRSPAAIQRWIAWNVFSRLPQRLQAVADAARRRIRRSRGAVHHLGTFVSAAEIASVRDVAARVAPDLIVYDGIFNCCGRIAGCETWLIAHEVKHQRGSSFAAQGVDIAASAVSAETEAGILAQVDTVLAIQWDDARELSRLAPLARVVVVPAAMALPERGRVSAPIAGRCMFVGSGSFHNFDGLAWFLKMSWPRVRHAMPSATLEVYGSVCSRLGDVPDGVTLHGTVDDLAPAYASAAVTIVPLRIGSGLKVKVIEAFAYEQAVVTTHVGAQGLLALTPRPFVLAGDHAEFADGVLAVLASSERQETLRAAARQCAQSFTPEAAFADFDAALARTTEAVA